MTTQRSLYQSQLAVRYASKEMLQNFSDDKKFTTWRKLWVALAEAEKTLGLDISDEQIQEMRANIHNINYEEAEKFEKELGHDVMAHIRAFGTQCPKAKPIIHLGATSAFVVDNTDIIIMRDALEIIENKLLVLIYTLFDFAKKYRKMPIVAYTHLQPAQLTTLGKRATLWLYDLYLDEQILKNTKEKIVLLGSKGAIGTQSSFLNLFNGDSSKVAKLDELICRKFGFKSSVPVSGQTYTRKMDAIVAFLLSSIAQSAAKFANDIRFLQSIEEIEEPFEEKSQVGSSAMPHKRNPVLCERITGLARFVIITSLNSLMTASSQFLERTLDDSANKRVTIPELFLSVDSILELFQKVASGLKVNEEMINTNIRKQMPFLISETILMEAAKEGLDRQETHELIRKYSLQAIKEMQSGRKFDLIEELSKEPKLEKISDRIKTAAKPENLTGLASQQTENFLNNYIEPLLKDRMVAKIIDDVIKV